MRHLAPHLGSLIVASVLTGSVACAPGLLVGGGEDQDGEITADAGPAGDTLVDDDLGAAGTDGVTLTPDTTTPALDTTAQAADTKPPAADSKPPVANKKPIVQLTTPFAGASFNSGATIQLKATASDPDGKVVSVKFYAGSKLLKIDSAAPFAHSWTGAASGTFQLTAQAVDNRGGLTVSSPVSITISAPSGTSYSKTIQPILNSRCKSCHGPTKAAGQYRVDTYQLTMKAGVSGKAAVTAQNPNNSLLWSIEANPKGSCGLCWHKYFTAAELNQVKAWINQGALNN